jgi:hypothetical protein
MSIFHIINFKKKIIMDFGILLIIDLSNKKGKKGGGEFYW